jgi:gas vesicle protein
VDSGKVVLGVLAGIATGAILGILFAPEKGIETRKKICKKGTYNADDLKDKFNEFLESISAKFEQIKDDVSNFAEQAKTKAEDVKKDIQG